MVLAARPEERRDAWAAFLTLFGLVGSHAILETYEARAETEIVGYVVSAEDFMVVMEMHLQEGLALLRTVARGVIAID